jgi:HEPN domain-containing protein
MVNVQKLIEYWKEGAREDLEYAEFGLQSGKTRQSLFMGHLAIEKILKSLVCKKIVDVAPRTHNLVRLAEIAEIKLTAEQIEFFETVNSYNVGGRYPESMAKPPSMEEAVANMKRIRELFEWLRNQL